MLAFLRRVAPALLLLAAPAAAQDNDERILHYWSDVQVQKDSSLEVTETIEVRAEHDRINHGIFRDFPTTYTSPHGGRVHIGFTFEGATLDGQPVPAKTEGISRGVRIRIGDADRLVDIGEHRYVIRYRATRELGFFTDYDEVYWNATGNGWIFPIDVAEVRIRLPEPVKFGQRSSYTGPQGATGTNAEVVDEKPGDVTFRTTQPLGENEGLTVAVAFPKGVVTQPRRSAYWLGDYGPPIIGGIGLVGLCIYFFFAWSRAGRDPRAGTVVPIFSPSDGLSPAGMRYIVKMGADNRTFAAALVDMGVRGHIRMVEENGGWFSRNKTRIDRLDCENPLPPEEEAALRELCMPGESIEMKQENHTRFSSARNDLSKILKDAYEGKMFERNYGWAAAGLLLWFAVMWFTAAAVGAASGTVAAWQIVTVIGALVVVALLWLAFHDSPTGKCLLSLLGVGAVALATSLGMPVFEAALNSGWYLPLIIPALAIPLVVSAFWWIAAPTREGRSVLDRIAGFKQYLSITERERLDRMTTVKPPPDTPEIFEKYLPYAIALGVENRWADRFQSVLAAAQAQGGGQQGFYWYSGSGNPWANPTSFVDTVGSSLASTISTASAAPGSGSGSGGGGSSGGGGGGGGGGGW
jgi:uncharacterized membrane protein YgcG